MITALLAAPFAPACAARRLDRLSLRRAWLLHLAMTGVFVLMVFCVGEAGPDFRWGRVRTLPERLLRYPAELMDEFDRDPWITGLACAATCAGVELGFAALAALLAPWGARDEPLRRSFAAALRRTWLFAIVAFWALAVPVAAAYAAYGASQRWDAVHPQPTWPPLAHPQAPTLAQSDPDYQNQWDQFNAAVARYNLSGEEYWNQRRAWKREKPWYLRNDGLAPLIILGSAAGLWTVLTLMRGAGAPRTAPPIPRDPTCDACGYNLTGMAIEARCPECGMAVVESLGDGARPGTDWQRRGDVGRAAAFLRVFALSETSPDRLGRQIRTNGESTDHRVYAFAWMPVVFLIGAVAVLCTFLATTVPSERQDELEVLPALSVAWGVSCVVGALAIMLASAGVVGWFLSLKAGRNLWPASMQIAAYLAADLAIWTAIGGAVGVALVAWTHPRNGGLNAASQALGVPPPLLFLALFFVPNAFMGIRFLMLLGRGTSAARHANR